MAYPSPVTAYPAQPQGPYVAPPPPIGYPTKVDSGYPQHSAPIETTTRGDDGFWKGWYVFTYYLSICLFISWKMLELQTTLQYFLLNVNVLSDY